MPQGAADHRTGRGQRRRCANRRRRHAFRHSRGRCARFRRPHAGAGDAAMEAPGDAATEGCGATPRRPPVPRASRRSTFAGAAAAARRWVAPATTRRAARRARKFPTRRARAAHGRLLVRRAPHLLRRSRAGGLAGLDLRDRHFDRGSLALHDHAARRRRVHDAGAGGRGSIHHRPARPDAMHGARRATVQPRRGSRSADWGLSRRARPARCCHFRATTFTSCCSSTADRASPRRCASTGTRSRSRPDAPAAPARRVARPASWTRPSLHHQRRSRRLS